MNNIDRFNECTAKLFATLYAHFPKPHDLDFYQWLGKDTFDPGDDDLEFAEATLNWLCESGYVTARGFHTGGAAGVMLTAKGLEVLKVVPDSLKSHTSIGDAIVEHVKSGAIHAAKSFVSMAMTEGFKLVN